jgi:acetyl esterase
MALNLKLKLLLWLDKQQNKPQINELSPVEARKFQIETSHKLALLTEYKPEKMHKVNEVAFENEGHQILMRIYQPSSSINLPVLMFFHGGGFVIGDLEIYDNLCRRLAKLSDCVVAAVDYRLAPEHKYPAAPNDCYTATVWMSENADRFGGDGSRIAVCGDSAGGNLATVVSMMARDKGGPEISYQVLIYPSTDGSLSSSSIQELAEGYLLTKSLMTWFLDHYKVNASDIEEAYFSPLKASDLSGLPPALVITAEYDPLKAEGREYAERLQAAGVPVKFVEYKGMVHVFIQMPKLLAATRKAQALIASELRTTFSIDGLVRSRAKTKA